MTELADAPPAPAHAPLAPAHTDWLHHVLRIDGPAPAIAAFRDAAAGAGTIPWHLDLDSLEEDWFNRLVSPPAPQRRSLSLEGARMLAGELREVVARRHGLAVARVGRSEACSFDLHALVPVPEPILLLGPDHPAALEWLWANWGTTQALRHVAVLAGARASEALHIEFWSADWTPWRALATVRAGWPALQFQVAPSYETA